MNQEKSDHCIMSRRCFLDCMGIGALTAAIAPELFTQPVEGHTSGDVNMEIEESKRTITETVRPEDLVTYCGRYCGRCGICGFNIQTSLVVLQNVVQVAGFRREAENLGWPLMRDIATHCCKEFEEQVDSFAQLTGKFFPSNCRGGCIPPCEIAKCCKNKGFFTCAECSDMEMCEKLEKSDSELMKNLRHIQKMGVKSWARKQFDEVTEAKRKALLEAVNKAFS